ncbi:hypothetical protein PG995_015497 [Apiospora arundinis]
MPDKSESARRTVNACIRCRSRKSRCDGRTPSCTLCQRHGAACEYTERRMRGAGKSKQYVQRLERRLERIESTMQTSHSPPLFEETADPQNGDLMGGDADGTILASRKSVATGVQPDSSSFFAKLPPPGTIEMIVAGHDQGCFRRTIFAPLPPKVAAQSMILNSFQDMCRAWPLFDHHSIRDMIDEQYNTGPADCHANSTRWAILNALLAMATQWKAANPLAKDVFPISWTYLKNAYAVIPELNLQATNLQVCQAIIIIVLFMRLTADARTATVLLSTATTMTNILGLCCEDRHLLLDSVESEQRQRTFWLTHILNNQAAMRYGLSPVYDDCQTGVGLPNDLGSATTGTMRHMAELSLIQTRAHTLMRSMRSSHGDPDELATGLVKIDLALYRWRRGLPADLQCPPVNGNLTAVGLDLGAVLLHLDFYATRWAMHSSVHSLGKGSGVGGALPKRASNSNLGASWLARASVDGAREVLILFRNVPAPPFAWFWYMLCYPVSAFLILLKEVLDDPRGDEASSNVTHISTFVQDLKNWKQKEGYDIQKVIEGCSKLLAIASFATTCPRSTASLPEMGMGIGMPASSAQFETLRSRLHDATHFMHLTQGLMSNMPIPYALATRTFSGILNLSADSADTFGPFVPDILKPRTYKFFYGST